MISNTGYYSLPGPGDNAVADWAANWIKWQGQAVVHLTISRSSTEARTQSVSKASLIDYAKRLSLKAYRGGSLVRSRGDSNLSLVITHSLIWIARDNGVFTLGGVNQPPAEWLQLLGGEDSVVILFSLRSISLDQLDSRSASATDVYQARIPVHQFAYPSGERFKFMNPFGEISTCPKPDSVVISDLNFLIDMRNVLSRGLDDDKFRIVRDCVAQLRSYDFRPGFGLAEAAWDRTTLSYRTGPRGREPLIAAINTWFDDPLEHFAQVGRLASAYQDRLRSLQAEPPQARLSEYREDFLMLLTYWNLLEFARLWFSNRDGKFNAEERTQVFEQWGRRVNNERTGGVSAYAALAIEHFLFSSSSQQSGAFQVLKLNKKADTVVANLYGAAWDLSLLSWVDGGALGDMPDADDREVWFFSGDQGLTSFRSTTALFGSVKAPSGKPMHYVSTDIELDPRFTEDHRARLDHTRGQLLTGGARRADLPPGQRLIDLITQTEATEHEVAILYRGNREPS